ncbi:MAG: hypothetical protein IKN12_13275 [Selenomonadaceae bacterium]|nr:hypothetical protein [Selenomonadaceae bacterium]MBR3723712.1 hypothetical protein [Selenomonadaceae bacterium]
MGKLKMGCLVVVGIFVLLGVLGALFGNNDKSGTSTSSKTQVKQEQKQEQKPKQYQAVSVSELMQELEGNAMAASKKYKGKDLKVTGTVEVMDSEGNYIVLHGDKYSIVGVHCTINKKDKAQEDFIMNIKKGQTVSASGTISDVGEIMGYTLKVDKFE